MINKKCCFLGLYLGLFLFTPYLWAGEFVPRTIYGIMAKTKGDETYFHPLQTALAMPLNHLGFKIEIVDISKSDFTKIAEENPDVRGMISWFQGDRIESPDAYLKIMLQKMTPEFKFLMLNDLAPLNKAGLLAAGYLREGVLQKMGLTDKGFVSPLRENIRYLFPIFEKQVTPFFTSIPYYGFSKQGAKAFVSLDKDGLNIPLLENLHGKAYGLSDYMLHVSGDEKETRWLVNPFDFLGDVFRGEKFPIPDTSTLNGNRIYYSHIDGDSWRSVVEASIMNALKKCPEVLIEKVLKVYPDLPLTMGFVTADIHPDWFGSAQDIALAKTALGYTQVEAGSHGWTHILDWDFYEDEEKARKLEAQKFDLTKKFESYNLKEKQKLDTGKGYDAPRSIIYKTFSLAREIKESAEFIGSLTNGKKPVKLFQWSGECLPFERAIKMTRDLGLRNINGGDSRFDEVFPSYAGVASVGLKVGSQQQIFSSNSNENIYTNDWTENFAGFAGLKKTFINTESPRRVKPMNIYYHLYSLEKQASVLALQEMLDYVKSKAHIPIFASHYAGIADGFYTARIEKMGETMWRVHDRDLLNTFRFDDANRLGVDFERSVGVMGQKHYQGNLYVATDPSVEVPTIALKAIDVFTEDEPIESQTYLVESRWLVRDMQRSPGTLSCVIDGFGALKMVWQCASKKQQARVFDGDQEVFMVENQGSFFKIETDKLAFDKKYRLVLSIL